MAWDFPTEFLRKRAANLGDIKNGRPSCCMAIYVHNDMPDGPR